jgi:hypothetical protein
MPTDTYHTLRQSAKTGLAVVGFLALIGLGIWGGMYSSRFIPGIVQRFGSAAVYVGSLFTPSQPATVSVVESASSTPLLETPSTTTAATTTPTRVATTTTPKPATTPVVKPAAKKTKTVTIATTTTPTLYGLPDLSIRVGTKGYLTSNTTDSFVASTSVPSGKRPAVQFTVTNIGTNVSGPWRFSAAVPTRRAYTYESDAERSLAPGDSIDFTLGFDEAESGEKQEVTIVVNSDNAVKESSLANNKAVIYLTIQ